MSDSVRPHRRQPTRLPRPWDSPGKNTGVGCHFLLQCMKVKSQSEVAQSYPTLSDPMDCSLPGSSVHGIFQARVLEWGAIAFSRKIYYYTPIRTATQNQTKQKGNIKWSPRYRTTRALVGGNAQSQDTEQLELLLVGMHSVSTFEKSLQFLIKLCEQLSYHLAITVLGIYLKEMKIYLYMNLFVNIYSDIFHGEGNSKPLQYSCPTDKGAGRLQSMGLQKSCT